MNKTGERDPEMHQVAKEKQCVFGMDSKEKIIHTVKVSAANVPTCWHCASAARTRDSGVWRSGLPQSGDAIRERALKAKDFINQRYRYNGQIDETERRKNRRSGESAHEWSTPSG